jgi:hypothetical protein
LIKYLIISHVYNEFSARSFLILPIKRADFSNNFATNSIKFSGNASTCKNTYIEYISLKSTETILKKYNKTLYLLYNIHDV